MPCLGLLDRLPDRGVQYAGRGLIAMGSRNCTSDGTNGAVLCASGFCDLARLLLVERLLTLMNLSYLSGGCIATLARLGCSLPLSMKIRKGAD